MTKPSSLAPRTEGARPAGTPRRPANPEHTINLQDLAALLVRHFDLHEGFYEAALKISVGVGRVPDPVQKLAVPGAVFGVSEVGLVKVEALGDRTVDAAIVNPRNQPVRRIRKVRGEGELP